MASIPECATILYITGIYEGNDSSTYHVLAEGDVIGWTTEEPDVDENYSSENIYSNVYIVALSDAGAAKFREIGWDDELSSPFWVNERDAEPVPDNVDAAARALCALIDKVVDAGLLKEMTNERTEEPAA